MSNLSISISTCIPQFRYLFLLIHVLLLVCDADWALCFLESSTVDGTMPLLVDAGAKSGVRDREGRGVMGDRGGCFDF